MEPQGSALWCHFRSSFQVSQGGVQLYATVLLTIPGIYWLSTVGEYLKGIEFPKQLQRYLQGLGFIKFKDPTKTCRLWRYLGKSLRVSYSWWRAKCAYKKRSSHHSFVSSVWSQYFWCGFRQMRWLLQRFPFAKCVHKKRQVKEVKATQKATYGMPGMPVATLQEAKTQKCDRFSWETSWESVANKPSISLQSQPSISLQEAFNKQQDEWNRKKLLSVVRVSALMRVDSGMSNTGTDTETETETAVCCKEFQLATNVSPEPIAWWRKWRHHWARGRCIPCPGAEDAPRCTKW